MKHLLIFFMAGLFSLQLLAQLDTIHLSEIPVSTQRTPTVYAESSRIVSIITREDIRFAPVQSLNELLETVGSVDMRTRGALGIQSDISIRGGSYEQTLILLNGIPINDPQTGHHSLNLPVDMDCIERIEILEGSAARVFGPNAFCGVINIVTRKPQSNQIKAHFFGGQNGLKSGLLSVSTNKKNIRNTLTTSQTSSDGYVKNTDFDRINMFYQTDIETKYSAIEIQAGFQNKRFGANSFYSPVYLEQFEHVKNVFGSVRFKMGNSKIKFVPTFYWKRNNDRFELFRQNPPSWYKQHNYHQTDVYGFETNTVLSTKYGKIAIGSAWRTESILSTVLGNRLSNPVSVRNEEDISYTYGLSRQQLNFFMEYSNTFKFLTLSTGGLINWHSGYDWHFYPGLDLNIQLGKYVRWFASANQSLRMPTFTDLYYQSPTHIGNPYLKPEQALSFETGLKMNYQSSNANVVVFQRRGTDIIDWIINPADPKLDNAGNPKWESKNLTHLTTNGIEVAYRLTTYEGSPSFPIKDLSLSYSFLQTTKYSSNLISRYALDYLKHKLALTVHLKLFTNAGLRWTFTVEDRVGSFTQYLVEKQTWGDEIAYKTNYLLDARMYWQLEILEIIPIQLYIEATNLFNITYYDYGNIAMPKRWLKAGITIDVNLRQ